MECKSCKHYIECLNEANKRGEIFDPEYDGERSCGANSFEKISNADRIRAMSDEDMAKHLVDIGWDCLSGKNVLNGFSKKQTKSIFNQFVRNNIFFIRRINK